MPAKSAAKDIAWLAGLLEGEGCFHINSSPTIQLTMTDQDIVEKFVNMVGSTGRITTHKPLVGKLQYRAQINGNLAIQWMMTLYSMLGVRRREKIKEIMNQWKLKHDNNIGMCRRGHELKGRNLLHNGNGNFTCRICRTLRVRRRINSYAGA